jgi:hypothetical protein
LLVANDRCEGRESHRTSEVLDVHLTPPSSKRKSADTHSSNDAARARPRGEDKLVLLFPVLPRLVECGLKDCAFRYSSLQRAFSFLTFAEFPSIQAIEDRRRSGIFRGSRNGFLFRELFDKGD